MIRYKVSPLFGKNGYMYMYNVCIELEDDIFNMIELFARDKTLSIFLYQIGIVEVVCFQNVHESSANFRDENFASVW